MTLKQQEPDDIIQSYSSVTLTQGNLHIELRESLDDKNSIEFNLSGTPFTISKKMCRRLIGLLNSMVNA